MIYIYSSSLLHPQKIVCVDHFILNFVFVIFRGIFLLRVSKLEAIIISANSRLTFASCETASWEYISSRIFYSLFISACKKYSKYLPHEHL